MKRQLRRIVFLALIPIFLICSVLNTPAKATSVSQIKIYTQNNYNNSNWSLAANSGETRNLKTAGCGLFAYAHAIEWLTGTKRGDDLLRELINVCSDPNGNRKHKNCTHSNKSDYSFLALANHAKNQYDITLHSVTKTEAAIENFLNSGGVFVLRGPTSDGGHMVLAVEFARNNGTAYVHIIDSHPYSLWSGGIRYYDNSFNKWSSLKTQNGADFWIKCSDIVSKSSFAINRGLKSSHTSKPTSIQLNNTSDVLYLSSNLQLTATVYPSGANTSITWSSSDTSIATVSNGMVTPIAPGDVTITATSAVDASVSATCMLQVKYNGNGSLTFTGIKVPKWFNSNGGFNWLANSGTISSDVNLTSVIFKVYESNNNVITSEIKNIGKKSITMEEMNASINMTDVSHTGLTYFEVTATDVLGRTLSRGVIFTSESGSGSANSNHANMLDITTNNQFNDPQAVDSTTLNNHRYVRYKSTYTWNDANAFAQKIGGHLATISSAEENAAIYSLVKKDSLYGAWIGLYRSGSSTNDFSWVTGEPYNWNNWYSSDGEPNKQWNIENYGAMRVTEGKWRDSANNNHNWLYFIVEFEPVIVQDIVLSGNSAPVAGESFTMDWTVLPEDAVNKSVRFSSSDTSIATVDADTGLVTTLQAGTVTIYATAQDGSNVQKPFTVYVQRQPIHVTHVSLDPYDLGWINDGDKTILATVGTEIELTACITPDDADLQDVFLTSSDPSIVMVEDYDMTITLLNPGFATVYVTTVDGGYWDYLDINVVPASGQCGDNAFWQFDIHTGMLTISGSGPMYDYDSFQSPWNQCIGHVKGVTIENGITGIGCYAFLNQQNLTTVTIPEGVTYINGGAFESCVSLNHVKLPATLAIIEDWAFAKCSSLDDVNFNDGITHIGNGAFIFSGFAGLDYLPSLSFVGERCFEGTHIDAVNLSTAVTEIYSRTFADCPYLVHLSIPASVTSIADDAVDITTSPDLVIYCDDNSVALEYALNKGIPLRTWLGSDFNSFVLPTDTLTIGRRAFGNVPATAIRLPNGVRSIAASAFDMPFIQKIYIPSSVTSIDASAFGGQRSLRIYGMTGSYAETYASQNGYTFIPLAEEPD